MAGKCTPNGIPPNYRLTPANQDNKMPVVKEKYRIQIQLD
jgi:hypothetical protein